MTWHAYIYEDPRTLIARYVGKGKDDRAFEHLNPCSRSNKQLKNLIKQCHDTGITISPTVIHCQSENTAIALERFWIAVFGRKDLGTGTLFNHTAGGDGRSGYTASSETCAKMSRSLSGANHWAYGRTGEDCPNFGKKRTKAEREHLSKVLSGRKQDPGIVARRAASNTGKKRTLEQLANLRAGQARYRASIKGDAG